MANNVNKYQGQIRAEDQSTRCFPSGVNIVDLIAQQDAAAGEVKYLPRIGIFAEPGTVLTLTNYGASTPYRVFIGQTWMYELSDARISHISFDKDSTDQAVVDFLLP